MAIAAAAAVAAAAVISMVALSFAIFGILRPQIGPANASAAVAAVFALMIGLAGLMAALRSGGGGRRRERMNEREAMGLADRLMELARDKPMAAVGVALALGLILMRSPMALGAIAKAFFETLGGGGRVDEL